MLVVYKPILETSKLQKAIYAKRRTVCVSGLAKQKTDIAKGRYETWKIALRKRRKPNPPARDVRHGFA